MPVIAKCRECGKQYRLRDDLAGSMLPCKSCGAEFRVPGSRQQEQTPKSRPRPAQRGGRPRDFDDRDDFAWDEPDTGRSGSSSLTFWLVGGATVAIVLIGVVVGILMFSGGKKDDNNGGDQIARNDPVKSVDPQLDNPGNPGGDNGFPAGRDPNPGIRPGGQPAGVKPRRPIDPPLAPANPGGLKPAVGPNPGGAKPAVQPPPKAIPNPGGLVKNNDTKPDVPRTAAIGWTAKADPPEVPIVFADTKRLVIPSPLRFGSGDVVFPTASSAVVAIGQNRNDKTDYRLVQDLRTNTKIGEIRGFKLSSTKGVISPDGGYFAAFDSQIKELILFDVKAGKRLGTLPIDDETKRGSRLKILDFAGPKRLVAAGDKSPLWVWNLPDGKDARSIPLPEDVVKESVAISPGGRYMAVLSTADSAAVVHVIDLTTGQGAGRITMPKEFRVRRSAGMAFSPDGKELAGFFTNYRVHRLYSWNMSNGDVATAHEFDKDPKRLARQYIGPALQWFPEKDRWLVHGNAVIDRKSGNHIWTVPKVRGSNYGSEARLLGSDRIALFGREGTVAALATMAVPKDLLNKASDIVKAGGTAADAGLPPLTKVDLSTAKTIPANVAAGNWAVTPDPAAKPEGKLLAASMSLKPGIGRVTGFAVSRGTGVKAIVATEGSATASSSAAARLQEIRDRMARRQAAARNRAGNRNRRPVRQPGPAVPAKQTKTPQLRLDRYDVGGSGKFVNAIDINFKSKLIAVSPSGSRAAIATQPGEERVDVYSFGGKPHVAGFRPYLDEKSTYSRSVKFAAFVDDEHLLTLSKGKKLVLWKLPECRAVYVVAGAGRPTFSPGRKYLGVAIDKKYRLLDAKTGATAGEIAVDGSPTMSCIHPSGERVAISFFGSGGSMLGVFNLRNGKAELAFPTPISAFASRGMEWAGDKHVLLSGIFLVDLKAKSVVWKYQLLGGTHAVESPDGRHWYVAGTRSFSLNATRLPDNATLKQLAGRDLTPKMILKPGGKISLNVQLNGVNDPNLANAIVKDWTRKLKVRGLTVAPRQPVTLFARAELSNTGESFEFVPTNRFGLGRNNAMKETVSQTVLKCRAVVGANNKSFAEKKVSFTNYVPNRFIARQITLKNGQTAKAYFHNAQSGQAAQFFRSYFPPGQIFDPVSISGLGSSRLPSGGN